MSYAEGLGIDENGRASGGIAHMSNAKIALQAGEDILVENFAHQTHALVMAHYSTVRNTNASTLLASMLESIKSEIGETSRIFVSINTKDAALFLWSAIRDYYAVLQDQFLVKCLKCPKVFLAQRQAQSP